MKKGILFALIAMLAVVPAGCIRHAEEFDPVGPISGGKVDRTDYTAPKKVKSRELTYFSDKFFLYGRYNYERDASYNFEVVKNDDGSVSIEEKACYQVKCRTDEHILKELQAIIEKYELAKLNGVDKHTAGLPPEYQPSYFEAKYASGESIYFSRNNDPDDPCAREVLKLLGDEFAEQGEDCFQPPVSASEISRFEIEFTDGDMRYFYGELHIPLEGKEKSFEELVVHGYDDGEYYVVIENNPWDRSGKTNPETVYREVLPEFYVGLKKVLDEIGIIDFVNDEQFPFGFDYEKTPDYFNFYIEYAYGNNMFGFSDDAERNREFAPVAKAIAEYIEGYINEDPKIMEY